MIISRKLLNNNYNEGDTLKNLFKPPPINKSKLRTSFKNTPPQSTEKASHDQLEWLKTTLLGKD